MSALCFLDLLKHQPDKHSVPGAELRNSLCCLCLLQCPSRPCPPAPLRRKCPWNSGIDSTAFACCSAYRVLALKHHPDKNNAPEAQERFKRISHAYAILRFVSCCSHTSPALTAIAMPMLWHQCFPDEAIYLFLCWAPK